MAESSPLPVSLSREESQPLLSPLESEIKFRAANRLAPKLQAFLDATCAPDSKHPENEVFSVYFDTPGLQAFAAKNDSDYLKRKVRIRWYAGTSGRRPPEQGFLEIKNRIGTLRTKSRSPLAVSGAELATWPLEDGRWRRLLVEAGGPAMSNDLLPVVRLRYVRRRYREPLSAGISLDTSIRADLVNTLLLPPPSGLALPDCVVECKTTDQCFGLPPMLRPLAELGCHRSSFSKYAEVVASLPH